ncbi:F-box/FBD/LRR-repeat protein-like protein [Tanacetum coccineum]
MDRLGNLPSSIIESILCLVPIQEAARTSILSREWMYRWTKIPNLVFEEDTFQVSTVDGAESSILDQSEYQSYLGFHYLSHYCKLLQDIRNPCISGSIGGPTSSAIFECLPVIETFSISFHLIRAFGAIDKVPRELSITLIHLKYLRLDGVYFNNKTHLSILALLIISSLNLEKLKVFDNSKSILDQTHEQRFKRQTMDKKSKLIYAICQVLLIHDGPINEFTLSLCLSRKHVKIDPILTYLSRKTRVEKLKFDFAWAEHILPLSHYSFRHLTDLHLIRCGFHLPPTFNGFGILTSLYLEEVIISTRTLQHLLSNCPLLKTLILDIRNPCISGSIGGPTSSAIFECLPVIETFSISFHLIRAFGAIDKVPRELSITLIHLKYLRLDGVYFNNKTHLSILALLIISSLNLEKLKVFDNSKFEISKRYCFRVEDYSDIMLERLNELEITSFINAKNQLDFVRLILARSLVLKKVRIFPHSKISMKEKSKIKLQILRDSVIYPCASPEVQIIVVG